MRSSLVLAGPPMASAKMMREGQSAFGTSFDLQIIKPFANPLASKLGKDSRKYSFNVSITLNFCCSKGQLILTLFILFSCLVAHYLHALFPPTVLCLNIRSFPADILIDGG